MTRSTKNCKDLTFNLVQLILTASRENKGINLKDQSRKTYLKVMDHARNLVHIVLNFPATKVIINMSNQLIDTQGIISH